jgi:hypothetical protein
MASLPVRGLYSIFKLLKAVFSTVLPHSSLLEVGAVSLPCRRAGKPRIAALGGPDDAVPIRPAN